MDGSSRTPFPFSRNRAPHLNESSSVDVDHLATRWAHLGGHHIP